MKTTIYCRPTDKGIHSFYLVTGDERYFLFCQDYRRSVQNYFSRGVSLQEAMNFSKTHKDHALIHTMSKLPMYIRYLEKEYDIIVMEQTRKKKTKRYAA